MSTTIRRSEGFFIESASTGRFRILDLEASNNDDNNAARARGWKLSQSQNSSTAVQSDTSALLFDKQVLGIAFIGFHFLQGIVSGMSVSSLYEALAFLDESQPRDFIALHSTMRANEIRRYFFLGITFCVLGSLCMIKEEDVSRVVGIIKGSSSSSSSSSPRITATTTWSSTTSLGCLIIFNFTALILTLLCSSVDFKIVINQSDEKLLSILQLWRCFSVTRGILCIVSWFISCYRFVIMRVRARDDRL